MKEIKVDVVDWLGEFEDNYFIYFLSKKYKIVRSDHPDYLLCSVFGNKHLKYKNCIKIFFTGENIVPDFNMYDYALGFCHLNFEDRYLRYPLFLLYSNTLKLAQKKHIINKEHLKNKSQRDFCSFVVSNPSGDKIREEFFEKIKERKFVASGGRFKNNVGYSIGDKEGFISQYKFNIAFENCSQLGYCTEKLIEALAAQTVPIYWGDPMFQQAVNEEEISFINRKSFINISDFSSLDDAIEFIMSIDRDEDAYASFLREPSFLIENIEDFYHKRLEEFFDNIFNVNIAEASRISKIQSYWYIRRTQPITFLKNRILNKIHFLKNIQI